METIWIEEEALGRALERNEAFWDGALQEGPLVWATARDPRAGSAIPEPATIEGLWTDVEFAIASAEARLAATRFAGDALPVFTPWLGPDQFAAWLGAELILRPREGTSWSRPFLRDGDEAPELRIDPENRWWRIYLAILRASVRAGEGKWVTGYPDLHTGIDALRAIRGPEALAIDLLERPDAIRRAMEQMTRLWIWVVDRVSEIILPAGQGTSNWTMGWSAGRFLCIGQNDFSCALSPEMFDAFCLPDIAACVEAVDRSLYHLDGPGAIRHLPSILGVERLNCVQWIQGAGKPPPSRWLDLLRRIQGAGKSVQLYYGPAHGGDADLEEEIRILCEALDPRRLFLWIELEGADEAERVVAWARRAGRRRFP